jgi:hypothetical protein
MASESRKYHSQPRDGALSHRNAGGLGKAMSASPRENKLTEVTSPSRSVQARAAADASVVSDSECCVSTGSC